jgi:hypothetical protein
MELNFLFDFTSRISCSSSDFAPVIRVGAWMLR